MSATSHLQPFINKELLHTESGLSVFVGDQVPESDHEPLWDMVQAGFVDLNRKSYEPQDMTQDEFAADLESPDVIKFVAHDEDKLPVGLLTVHADLDDITWTDTTPLREVQDRRDPNARSYYVGTLVVPPSMRGSEAAPYLVKGSFLSFNESNKALERDSLVFFDCAHANYPWLGTFVQKIGQPDKEFPHIKADVEELYEELWLKSPDRSPAFKSPVELPGHEVLDRQHYYAISIDTAG